MRRIGDIFVPVVSMDARHEAFEALRTSEAHLEARHLMNEIAQRMGDVDGHFVREFQTQFHARLFELAGFAYLEAQDLEIDRSHARPDFVVRRDGVEVATIEAVTSNPQAGQRVDVTVRALTELPIAEIIRKSNEEFPIRIGTALFTKLKKEYWSLPHCRNLPFVLAIGPFHEPGSQTYIDQSLARYLYGMDQFSDWVERNGILTRQSPVEQHTFDGKTIPSEFFAYPGAENVSAVVYCNQFSVSKFFRMAVERDGMPPALAGIRKGYHLDPEDGWSEYSYELGSRESKETWWEGVTVLHNPYALHPLAPRALSCSCEFRYHEGFVDCSVYGFHSLTSSTFVQSPHRPESADDE